MKKQKHPLNFPELKVKALLVVRIENIPLMFISITKNKNNRKWFIFFALCISQCMVANRMNRIHDTVKPSWDLLFSNILDDLFT